MDLNFVWTIVSRIIDRTVFAAFFQFLNLADQHILFELVKNRHKFYLI